MKKIQYITFFIFTVILVSCNNKFLTVAPLDALTDLTFWKTETDATMALNGCYLNWEQYTNIGMDDGGSDNAWAKSYTPEIFGNGTATAANSGGGAWVDSENKTRGNYSYASFQWYAYTQIYKYNDFLANIDNVTMNADTKTRYKAEVRFLRAYDYFWKVRLYGDMPLVTTLISPDAKPKRDPAATINDFILKELTEITPMLPVQNNIDSQGHITAGAAVALKARLELFLKNYTAAMTDAQTVINMGVYELYPNYRELFLEGSIPTNKEVIAGIQFIPDTHPETFEQLSGTGGDGGWSAMNAGKGIVDAYECSNGKTIDDPTSGYDINHPFDNRDPRLALSLYYPGEYLSDQYNISRYYDTLDQYMPDGSSNPDYHNLPNASRSGMNCKKYCSMRIPNWGSYPPNLGNNFHAIRLAEMYLTYAEAAVESGTNTGIALGYINLVRARVGHVAATALTRDLVRRERRVELAFEGLRYFDVARWDLGAQTMNGPFYGSRLGTVDVTNGNVTWTGDGNVVTQDNYIEVENRVFHPERNYLYPIPQSEIDANPNMVQNPGY